MLGGVAMVVWLWPDNTINTVAEVFEAIVGILGFCTSAVVVWFLWTTEG